jgi:hypothetical protein
MESSAKKRRSSTHKQEDLTPFLFAAFAIEHLKRSAI